MFLGRVIGNVVSTQKDSELIGYKLLLVAPAESAAKEERDTSGGSDASGIKFGADFIVAVDTVCSGVGETVLVATGRAARNAVKSDTIPVDSAIVGIVDTIDIVQ